MESPQAQDLLHKRLIFSILQHLNTFVANGPSSGVDVEGLEVAIQCVGSSFGVDINNADHQAQYGIPVSLPQIFVAGLEHVAQAQAAQAQAQAQTQQVLIKFFLAIFIISEVFFFCSDFCPPLSLQSEQDAGNQWLRKSPLKATFPERNVNLYFEQFPSTWQISSKLFYM